MTDSLTPEVSKALSSGRYFDATFEMVNTSTGQTVVLAIAGIRSFSQVTDSEFDTGAGFYTAARLVQAWRREQIAKGRQIPEVRMVEGSFHSSVVTYVREAKAIADKTMGFEQSYGGIRAFLIGRQALADLHQGEFVEVKVYRQHPVVTDASFDIAF